MKDSTNTGFTVSSETDLTDDLVILPKFFRQDDELCTTSQGQNTTLNNLVEVSRPKVTLTVPPEDIVFIES